MGFGRFAVSGRSLVPSPAANTTADDGVASAGGLFDMLVSLSVSV